jgi:hypothetical protein
LACPGMKQNREHMGRKNRRLEYDLALPTIKDERRSVPRCNRFPGKTVFTTGYRAQVAVDEIQAHSDRDKTPVRVYSCDTDEGGCGYFHITSQHEYTEAENSRKDRNVSYTYDSGYTGAEY